MIWASSQLCGKILGRWIIHVEVGTPKAIHNIQETLWSEKTGLWTLHLTDRRNSSLQYKHSSSRKKPNLLHCNPIFWSEHRTLNCAPDTSEFMLSKCCPCFCRYWSSIDCFPQFYSCKLWRNITVLHHKTYIFEMLTDQAQIVSSCQSCLCCHESTNKHNNLSFYL